jgi:hypothetical protein
MELAPAVSWRHILGLMAIQAAMSLGVESPVTNDTVVRHASPS